MPGRCTHPGTCIPAGMPPDTPGKPSSEPPRGEDGTDEEHRHAQAPVERFGPLQLIRVHKDDGRELIFFTDTSEPG
jgi:hypothetical protein